MLDDKLMRMRQHFEAVANFPPNMPQKVKFTWSGSAYTLAGHLKHAGKGQLMREVAIEVLWKHARVRSEDQYFKILSKFQKIMYAQEWCMEQGLYSITDIGIKVWLTPVVKRWRLVRKAATLCAEAARRERWWLAFAERAFHPDAAAVDAAATEFAALAAN